MLPSPNMEAKSQLLNLNQHGLYLLKLNLEYFMQNKNLHDLCLHDLGLAFRSTQLSTQVPSLTSKNCCDVDIHVIVGIPYEVLSPNFHALNGWDWTGWPSNDLGLRVASHTRLSARDHYTSSTLNGGKGGAGPSSLHTTLVGPTEYVNARWM